MSTISARTIEVQKQIITPKEENQTFKFQDIQMIHSGDRNGNNNNNSNQIYEWIKNQYDILKYNIQTYSEEFSQVDQTQDVWTLIENQIKTEFEQNQGEIQNGSQRKLTEIDQHINHQKHMLLLNNYKNIQYFTSIKMGSKEQPMTVDLDTGSHQLWVPTIDCKDQSGQINCHKENEWFNYKDSNTCKLGQKEQQLKYAKGTCTGIEGSELVDVEGVQIRQENVLFVHHVDKHIRRSLKSDGILGLSNKKQYDNFIDIAYKNGQIKSNKFAMNLRWKENTSQFIFDDIPSELENEAVYVKSSKENYWTIHINNIEIDGISQHQYLINKDAVIDSGTSYILFNEELFRQFWSKLEATGNCQTNQSGSFYMCKCSEDLSNYKYPTITISTNGAKFILDAQDYLDHQNKGEYCDLEVRYLPGKYPLMLFGDAFMRKYTVIYDKEQNQMGFVGAELIENTSSSILMILSICAVALLLIISIAMGYLYSKSNSKSTQKMPEIPEEKEQLDQDKKINDTNSLTIDVNDKDVIQESSKTDLNEQLLAK